MDQGCGTRTPGRSCAHCHSAGTSSSCRCHGRLPAWPYELLFFVGLAKGVMLCFGGRCCPGGLRMLSWFCLAACWGCLDGRWSPAGLLVVLVVLVGVVVLVSGRLSLVKVVMVFKVLYHCLRIYASIPATTIFDPSFKPLFFAHGHRFEIPTIILLRETLVSQRSTLTSHAHI